MPKLLTIQIPQPCGEDPARMLPSANGSYCNSCKKEVIDFTLMSDERVAAFISRQPGHICGRFYPDQLNKAIPLPKKQLPWAKYFFTIAIPAFLISLRSSAQNKLNLTPSSITATANESQREISSDTGRRWVEGYVTDQKGNAVEAAAVIILKTRIGTTTDQNGKFRLLVPVTGGIISVSSIGITSTEINIPASGQVNIIVTRVAGAYEGEVTVITTAGGISSQITSNTKVPKKAVVFTGKVVDQKGDPVEAASVLIVNSRRGTITDQNGEFEISIRRRDESISISGVGIVTKIIPAAIKPTDPIVVERSAELLPAITINTTGLNIKRYPGMLGMMGSVSTIRYSNQIAQQQKKTNEVNIYPNPVHSGAELNISWKDKVQSDQLIEIFSADGNLIQKETVGVTGKISACSFVLKDTRPGFYIFMVLDMKTGEKMSKEFIVE